MSLEHSNPVLGPIPMTYFGFGEVINPSLGKNELGGKGANLVSMSYIGIPVPKGVIIPTTTCLIYRQSGNTAEFSEALVGALGSIHSHLSPTEHPCLMSVRSGARVSMPGMMDTILNVGMTSTSYPYWAGVLGARTALDCYRRLIQMYSSVALGVPMHLFEQALNDLKVDVGVVSDSELDESHLTRLVAKYLDLVLSAGQSFPDTVEDQLLGATLAVFKSWDNHRAVEYRKIHGYSDDWGTAVTIQAMVFGNLGDSSATGVVFTRCPSTGSPDFVGEYLVNAQGEDVVAGTRTPEPLHSMAAWNPSAYYALKSILQSLEVHYRDMQDVEFTVQDEELFILQTRSGKRAPKAAFRIAHDLAVTGAISTKDALSRVSSGSLIDLLTDHLDPSFKVEPHLVGIAAGGGVVSGVAVFSSEDAVASKAKGLKPILIRKETDPNDIAGMNASVGILTSKGGLTSHAAVVARGLNKTCVVGAISLVVDNEAHASVVGGVSVCKGDPVTLDGATGNVWFGTQVPVLSGGLTEEASAMVRWALEEQGACLRWTPTLEDLTKGSLPDHTDAGLWIDTALLEGKSVEQTSHAMICLRDVIASHSSSTVVLDLHCVSDLCPHEDYLMDFMFGVPPNHLEDKESELLQWPTAVASKCLVLLPPRSKGKHKLKAVGFKTSTSVTTVLDLITANGPVSVTPSVISTVFGNLAAYEELCALLATQAKHNITKTPHALYWFESLEAPCL